MYVEADLLYAYLKPKDWLKEYSIKILNRFNVATSVITVTEIELVSKRDFGNEFSNLALEKLGEINNLKFVDLNIEIIKKSVEFRKEYNINIFDALHAATAFKLKKRMISTDRIFDIIKEVKRIDPRSLSI